MDVVAVWKLDRLGRSFHHLVNLVEEFRELHVDLVAVTQGGVDTSSPAGRVVFAVFSAIAEFERELIRERTIAGMARARARGRGVGRRPVDLDADLARLVAEHPDAGVNRLARMLGVSRATVYRRIHELRPATVVEPTDTREE